MGDSFTGQKKRPNQQYQSRPTERESYKGNQPPKKQTTQYTHYTYKQHNKERHIYNTASPLVYTNMGVNRGRLSQRAGSPSLNGGEAAAAVPPYIKGTTKTQHSGLKCRDGTVRRRRRSVRWRRLSNCARRRFFKNVCNLRMAYNNTCTL